MVYHPSFPKNIPRNKEAAELYRLRNKLVTDAYFVFDLSRKEICAKYNLSRGTVNGILNRTMRLRPKPVPWTALPYDCGYLDLRLLRAMHWQHERNENDT